MSRNPRTPLTLTTKEALEILEVPIEDYGENGCPRDDAHQLLLKHETFDQDRADRAIHQLLMRGYFYKAGEHLFVTP